MGQFQARKDDQATLTSVAGSKVWLESCSVCHRPVTIVAPTKPTEPRCSECVSTDDATAVEGDA